MADMSGDAFNKGKDALKKIGLLILSFAVIFGLFRLILALSEQYRAPWLYYIGVTLYAVGGIAAFIAYFVLNGFSFSSEERTKEELPDKWTEDEKDAFLARQPENKRKAKKLIYIILPLILTAAVSYIELYLIK